MPQEWIARFALMVSALEDFMTPDGPTRKRRAKDLVFKQLNTPFSKRCTKLFSTPNKLEMLVLGTIPEEAAPGTKVMAVDINLKLFQNAVQASFQQLKNQVLMSEKVSDGLVDSINVLEALIGNLSGDHSLPPTVWGAIKAIQRNGGMSITGR
mmetsp:Transcript_23794/g.36126  ORF Transcript_23794/g.36126 Transcript_23794/m.36126 type:complete len:153 (-) Transcript_23794:2818-3276(-)